MYLKSFALHVYVSVLNLPLPDYVVYAVPAARMIVSSIIHDANTPFDIHCMPMGSMSLVN